MINFKNFFKPKRVAVIGASRNPSKVGHVIVKNILDGDFPGEVFPVNNKAYELFGMKVYSSILKVPKQIDLAIIAVPAKFVIPTVNQCAKKGIKDVLIVTAGFGEIGDHALEKKLRQTLDKHNMRTIGVNCLGVFDAHNKFDTMFLPSYRLERPEAGGISFICQSGAVGSATLDVATAKGHRFAKFISYGNATQVDESDLLEYLGNDKDTKVICLYVEGIKDGEKFYKVAKKVSKKKPIVALKGGLSDRGQQATMSHTGSLAGKKEVYFGVFNQCGIIRATTLEEMFSIASLVGQGIQFKGGRVQVITNGGGYGIVSTDNIVASQNIEMAEFSESTKKELRKAFSKNVSIANPLDLVADATTESYKVALDACIKDKNVDAALAIVLFQTPLVTTNVVEVLSEARRQTKKPIIVVSTGAGFTENLSDALRSMNVPSFTFPEDAITAMDKLLWYEKKKKTL